MQKPIGSIIYEKRLIELVEKLAQDAEVLDSFSNGDVREIYAQIRHLAGYVETLKENLP